MTEKRVSCSFCDEEHPSSAIGEHLMLCGNKTDQCPNCKKYIRRAIFAYHYENSCANLDESEPEVKAAPKQSEITSTFQPNYIPPSSSRPSARNDTNTTIVKVNFPTTTEPQPTISRQSNSGSLMSVVCSYCRQECDLADSVIHREKCLLNPKNMANMHQPQDNPISNQNTVPLNYVDQSNNNTDIPCQYCSKLIRWREYHTHTQACVAQHYPPTLQQPQPVDIDYDHAFARCRHCNNQYMINCITYHDKNCKQNPDNIAREEQLRALYYPLPLHITHHHQST